MQLQDLPELKRNGIPPVVGLIDHSLEMSKMPEPTLEEHWRSILLERLQKMESSMGVVQSTLGEVKTSSAVAATESKQRSEAMVRVETDLKDLTKVIRDLEKRLGDPPKGQDELEKRIKGLEDWQHNLTGRLVVIGALTGTGLAVLTSVVTALIVKSV